MGLTGADEAEGEEDDAEEPHCLLRICEERWDGGREDGRKRSKMGSPCGRYEVGHGGTEALLYCQCMSETSANQRSVV